MELTWVLTPFSIKKKQQQTNKEIKKETNKQKTLFRMRVETEV